MNELQRYVFDNIYSSTMQDKQFHFKLSNTIGDGGMVSKSISLYERYRVHLPDQENPYKVFTISNINPHVLNLLTQHKLWYRDSWVKLIDDANERSYLFQVYSKEGRMCPADNVYYSYVNERTLLIAVRWDKKFATRYRGVEFEYLRLYSNFYFNTQRYEDLPVKLGIKMMSFSVPPARADRAAMIQSFIDDNEAHGGKVIMYHNGYYVNKIPDELVMYDFVDLIYDQSIVKVERLPYSSLVPFTSTLDDRVKLGLYRDEGSDTVQFKDDLDLYVLDGKEDATSKGLYFYKHKDYVVRNITNKDFSIDSAYLGNQIRYLNEETQSFGNDKWMDVYIRDGDTIRPMIHSSIKLNELYKLSIDELKDLMNNTAYTTKAFRVEQMEASRYFDLMNTTNPKDVTLKNCVEALGYSGVVSRYGGSEYHNEDGTEIEIPLLYRGSDSVVISYEQNGALRDILTLQDDEETFDTSGYPISFMTGDGATLFEGDVPLHQDGYITYELGEELPSELDVWLNMTYMNYGVDYSISDGVMYFHNKNSFNVGGSNHLSIRLAGLTYDPKEVNRRYEVGFIRNGVVSSNCRYNIRDDKAICVYIDGKFKSTQDTLFAEDLPTEVLDSPLNGKPYTITDRYLSVSKLTDTDTMSLIYEEDDRNRELEDVMSIYRPNNCDLEDQVIEHKYPLISNAIRVFIEHIVDGTIPSEFYIDEDGKAILLSSKYLELANSPEYKDIIAGDVIYLDLPFEILEIWAMWEKGQLEVDEEVFKFIEGYIEFLLRNSKATIHLANYFIPSRAPTHHYPLLTNLSDLLGGAPATFERSSKKYVVIGDKLEAFEEDVPVFLNQYLGLSVHGLMLERQDVNSMLRTASLGTPWRNLMDMSASIVVENNEERISPSLDFPAFKLNVNSSGLDWEHAYGQSVPSSVSGQFVQSAMFKAINNEKTAVLSNWRGSPPGDRNHGVAIRLPSGEISRRGSRAHNPILVAQVGDWHYVEGRKGISSGTDRVITFGGIRSGSWSYYGFGMTLQSRFYSSKIFSDDTVTTRAADILQLRSPNGLYKNKIVFDFQYLPQNHAATFEIITINNGELKVFIAEKSSDSVDITITIGGVTAYFEALEIERLSDTIFTVELSSSSENSVRVALKTSNNVLSETLALEHDVFLGDTLTVSGWAILSNYRVYV